MAKKKPRPPTGSRWRILAHGASGPVSVYSRDYPGVAAHVALRHPREEMHIAERAVLDEVVLDDFFHLEQMDTNHWWMLVGGVLTVEVTRLRSGKVTVSFWEDRPGGAHGLIETKAGR